MTALRELIAPYTPRRYVAGGPPPPEPPRRRRRPRASAETRAAVVAARTTGGLTVTETAARFGIDRGTVRRIQAQQQATPGPDDLIPPGEAAAILGMKRKRLSAAPLPGLEIHRTSGGHRRYRRGQVTAAAERLQTTARAQPS